MHNYLQFLSAGLILGLFTEFELKLVAGVKPATFVLALCIYPVIISLAYAGSRWIDRLVASTWQGDMLHYIASGLGGLIVEWSLLGNGPGSSAFQPGMLAMWTSFCFGPRILIRKSSIIDHQRKRFWIAFGITSVLLTSIVLLIRSAKAKIVIAVVGLSGAYMVWSIWLLGLAWRTRHMAPREKKALA